MRNHAPDAPEKIVCRQIGTTTWQGPESSAPMPNPVLTPAQVERLAILIEECGEVIQEATKIMRFGFESFHPDDADRESNRHRLAREMTDLRAAYDLLTDCGDADPVNPAETIISKNKKIARSRYQRNT